MNRVILQVEGEGAWSIATALVDGYVDGLLTTMEMSEEYRDIFVTDARGRKWAPDIESQGLLCWWLREDVWAR